VRIGFTGTQEGMSQHQKEQFVLKMLELQPTEFHHGDCIGADAEAHDIVREFFPNVKIVVYPPISTKKRAFKQGDEFKEPESYITRDYKIVDAVEHLIGTPKTNVEVIRSGTWTTIRYARKTNKPHTILER
jgi:hypothetical protein